MSQAIKAHQERLMGEAIDIVSGARREAYGPPLVNLQRIATLWSAYLCVALETPDHEDTIRDRLGYQACYIELVYDDAPVAVVEEWSDWPPDIEPLADAKWNTNGADSYSVEIK